MSYVERFPTPESTFVNKGKNGHKEVKWTENGEEKVAYIAARVMTNPWTGEALITADKTKTKSKKVPVKPRPLNSLNLRLPAGYEGVPLFIVDTEKNPGSASIPFTVEKTATLSDGRVVPIDRPYVIEGILSWAKETRQTALRGGVWLAKATLIESILSAEGGQDFIEAVEPLIDDATQDVPAEPEGE